MRRQATQGDVDFITGDYLAEVNLAENAEKLAIGKHDGWEPTAWDGLQQFPSLQLSRCDRFTAVFACERYLGSCRRVSNEAAQTRPATDNQNGPLNSNWATTIGSRPAPIRRQERIGKCERFENLLRGVVPL